MVARMKRTTDNDLALDVLGQIRQHRDLADSDVTATVDRDVVTLSGVAKTESEREAIEAAAKEVRGVRAIASDLLVRPVRERSDADIARAAMNAFQNQILIPDNEIIVIVRDGRVTLEGRVHSELQKMLAESEIKRLRGIESISNRLEINPEADAKKQYDAPELENAGVSNDSAWAETGEAEAG